MCFSFYFKLVFHFINFKKTKTDAGGGRGGGGGGVYAPKKKNKMKGVSEKLKIYDSHEDDHGWSLAYMLLA